MQFLTGVIPSLLCCWIACTVGSTLDQQASHMSHRVLLGSADHKYKKGDDVTLYANKVGPFQNPRQAFIIFWLVAAAALSCACHTLLQLH